ncbi:hypothetical protein [Psychrosphaera aestuarii]|uniref:hypothetical protein n=1 Tax=Psychrosphaera aestuarii TaxID=1266052 RepID=UPI001B32AADF|nr:hypothetical protein [Psychrosphaera aestuarii]
MKSAIKLSVTLAVVAVMSACSTKPTPEVLNENIPDWVLNPSIENGIAHAECVSSSGNMSIDKAQAIALARVGLAQQISTRVKALDKTFQERVDVEGQSVVGATFSSVSKQVTNQALVGATPIKTSYANFNGKNQLCVLTGLSPEKTDALFKGLIEASDRKLSMSQESVLYQEFKAYKAQQELDRELEKGN